MTAVSELTKNAIHVKDEEHWHLLRSQNVGASEVAALFGLSPYSTKFTMWHEKAQKVARPEFGNERTKWGTRQEPSIAAGIAEDMGWTIQKRRQYLTHKTVKGMGASLDYEIIGHPDGVGAFEIKNVDYSIFKHEWEEDPETGSFQAPYHIELQLQHQMAVRGCAWGAIGVLIGGNRSEVVIRKRHEPTIAKLESAVADFYYTIQAGIIPPVEEPDDLEVLSKVFNCGEYINLNGDINFYQLLSDDETHKLAEKEASDARKKNKANILKYLMDNSDSTVETDDWTETLAVCDGFKFSYKKSERKGYSVEPSVSKRMLISKNKK